MKKTNIDYYIDKFAKIINSGDLSQIILLKDGRVLKIYKDRVIPLLKSMGYDIEKILLESEKHEINSSIKKPLELIYQNNNFCGYIMDRAKGVSFNERNDKLPKRDINNLYKYARLHNNIEKIIKDSSDIVFPDLLTCDNIFVDKDLNIELIDFDGFQLGNIKTIGMSTSLGSEQNIMSFNKYYNKDLGIFTKELDIKSLIHLYFLDVFNIDLNKVGLRNPYTGKIVTIDSLFEHLNLTNYDLMHKVWKIFEENEKNEYLGDVVFDIAEQYNMTSIKMSLPGNIYLKKLTRK